MTHIYCSLPLRSFSVNSVLDKDSVFCYHIFVNRKQRKLLDAINQTPTKANIKFSDIEKLLGALGAEKIEGSGSRVSFSKDNETVFFHRPHPQKEAKKYQVEIAREFLERMDYE